jgi:putative oxidoreductase
MRKSNPTKDIGLLLLRVAFAGAMLTHGWPKLLKLIAGGEIRFPDPFSITPTASLALTVFGEFVAPILIIIGLKTRLSAIPAAFTMAVAFFYIHASDPFGDKEMAFVYFIAFTAIALLGGGKISIDGILSKNKRR